MITIFLIIILPHSKCPNMAFPSQAFQQAHMSSARPPVGDWWWVAGSLHLSWGVAGSAAQCLQVARPHRLHRTNWSHQQQCCPPPSTPYTQQHRRLGNWYAVHRYEMGPKSTQQTWASQLRKDWTFPKRKAHCFCSNFTLLPVREKNRNWLKKTNFSKSRMLDHLHRTNRLLSMLLYFPCFGHSGQKWDDQKYHRW